MCTAALSQQVQKGKGINKKAQKPLDASDVPLGTGLADVVKTSILERRSKIEQAMVDAGV